MKYLFLLALLLFVSPAFAYITITQDSPLGTGTTYYTKNLSISFTIDTDGTLDKCWRDNNNYFTGSQRNISIVDCQNTSYIAYPYVNYFWIWANTTSGEVNCSTYGYSSACDIEDYLLVSPTAVGFINMSSPANITYPYPQDIDLNFTPQFTESGITSTSCEYQLDSGGWSGLGDCYSNSTLTSLTETQHDVQVRMEVDGSGGGNDYMLSPDIFFTLGNASDTAPPIIAIQAPSGSVTSPFHVNFTAEDETALDSCWYSVDSGSNTSIPSCSNFTDSASLGSHNITVYANDTSGNTGSDTNAFSVSDTINPEISIQSPSGIVAPPFNLRYTASDDIALDSCWYSLNYGPNISLPSCSNTTASVSAGDYIITVYANDTSNNIGSDAGAFTVKTPPILTGPAAATTNIIPAVFGVMVIIAGLAIMFKGGREIELGTVIIGFVVMFLGVALTVSIFIATSGLTA